MFLIYNAFNWMIWRSWVPDQPTNRTTAPTDCVWIIPGSIDPSE